MAKQEERYKFGMMYRGYSIGCQPMDGLLEVVDDPSGRYHTVLVYDRMLTGDEVADYELTYLGKMD